MDFPELANNSMRAFVVIMATPDPLLASRAAMLLEEAHIACQVSDQGSGGNGLEESEPGDAGGAGRIRVRVPAQDAFDAVRLLRSLRQAGTVIEGPDFSKSIRMIRNITVVALACILLSPISSWFVPVGMFLLCPALAMAFPIAMFCVPGYFYRQRMNRLDYDWPTVMDAGVIFWQLGKDAHSIPPASDLEMIPGYGRSCEGVISFVLDRAEYLKFARHSPIPD